jgi:hypothetical protein
MHLECCSPQIGPCIRKVKTSPFVLSTFTIVDDMSIIKPTMIKHYVTFLAHIKKPLYSSG